jgi:hypothetical protein
MNTGQLLETLVADRQVSKMQFHVGPCNRPPPSVRYPAAIITNTDPQGKSGQHWVAIFYDSKGDAEYFDSYGAAPSSVPDIDAFFHRYGKNHKYSSAMLQGLASAVCGQYCVAFLTSRARGIPFARFVSKFTGRKPGDLDNVVECLVNTVYPSAVAPLKGKQCCVSRGKIVCCSNT